MTPQGSWAALLSLLLAAPAGAAHTTAASAPGPSYTGVFNPAVVSSEWQAALGSFGIWASGSPDPAVSLWGGLQTLGSPANTDPTTLAALAPLVNGLIAQGRADQQEAMRLRIAEAYRADPEEQQRILSILVGAAMRGAQKAARELHQMVDNADSPEKTAAALRLARVLGDLNLYSGEPRQRMQEDFTRAARLARQLQDRLGSPHAALAEALGDELPAVEAAAPAPTPTAGLKPAPMPIEAGLVIEDPAMRAVFRSVASKIAPAEKTTVLIRGETGTGKDVVARALHLQSPRKSAPFVAVNMGAISQNLLESELFGHKKGAFTGADRDKIGYFETVGAGTLFLDEIGDLSLDLQVKLLRVLQNRAFTPVGSVGEKPFHGRIVAATHQDLEKMVKEGRFRSDLYYRLNVVDVHLPPLRERPKDILPLAASFLARVAAENGGRRKRFSPEALGALAAYHWPGNVRELENAVERAYLLADGELIQETDLPRLVRAGPPAAPAGLLAGDVGIIDRTLEELEKLHIEAMLRKYGWNKSQVALLLGIERSTLDRKIKAYGLTRAN